MKIYSFRSPSSRDIYCRRGFALIATIALMVLFSVIALGMLNLSTASQRNSARASAEAAAQANARMALMMAIGQLQQLSGADTRVTASSTMIDPANVQMTGVWRSWEGSDRLDDGQPIAPNYAMKFKLGVVEGSDPNAGFSGSPNDGRFLGWLTSADGLPDSPTGQIPASTIASSRGSGMVKILGGASVASATEKVFIKPTPLEMDNGFSGAVAWWTSGDNQKAMLNADLEEMEVDTLVQWQQRVRAGGRADPEVFDLEDDGNNNLLSDQKIHTTASLQLLPDSSNDQKLRRFHDLTVLSLGLLTNTANGGWRRDLSLMTESYDGDTSDGDPAYHSTTGALPSDKLPFYTMKPGELGLARKANGSDATYGSLVYPWAEYRDVAGRPESYAGPIGSWTSLVDYSMQYKQLRRFSPSKTQYAMREERIEDWPTQDAGSTAQNRMLYADKVRVLPVFARIHFIFSLAAEAGSDPDDASVTGFHPQLLITPIVTMWNPYNVQLEIERDAVPDIRLWGALAPLRFKINMNGQPLYPATDPSGSHFIGNSLYDMMRHMWGEKNHQMSLRFPSAGNLTLEPGEARLYSIANPTPQSASNSTFTLTDSYVPGGGFLIDLLDLSEVAQEDGEKKFGAEFGSTNNFATLAEDFVYHRNNSNRINKLLVDGASAFTAVAISVTGMNMDGMGYLTQFNNQGMGGGKGRIYSSIQSSFTVDHLAHGGASGAGVIESIWPNLDDGGNLLSGVISSFANSSRSGHFAAAIQSLRGASPLASFEEFEYHHLESKGMLQTNPLSFIAQMGRFADNRPGGRDLAFASMAGTGAYHPINSPMEFSFRPLSEIGSQYGWLPEGTDGTSYFMSGMLPTDGLTRSIIAEIPTRPLQSLVDLLHWDARAANPVPPFQFNLIGNASATPIIPPDRLYVKGGNGALNEHMCNDDSYLLNQMLFDDWFVSSIAPDFGDEGVSEERSLAEVYKDHLSGDVPLPNRFYVPSHEAASDDIDAAVAEVVSGSKSKDSNQYAYESIASKLTVDGMFNVNSASLDAWRALLRQGGSMVVPYLDADGRTSLDKARSYSFPRTSIAGDQGSNSGSRESGNPIFGAAEFVGHRVLTEEQIDAFAEEIVSEIRERGPFLSLSEFVNRQVTSDKDLAIAGTIQKALDNLAALGPNDPLNPFAVLQTNSVEIASQPPGNPDYGFPEAALGHASFGAPGWVRQADILRPLAPRLSARDDTFTIRAYGEARDPANPNKVLARAWCEAVVVRSAEYVDPVDDATVLPYSAEMKSKTNRQFGRKYRTVSFRWLNPSEI